MEKQLFAGYSDEQRLEMLQSNCNRVLEDYGYEKPLSKDQLKNIKDAISSASVSLHDVQEEKKETTKEFNNRIKDIKATIANGVKQLKTRTTYACEQCFELIDYDERKVGIYNREGILVEERPANLKELREPKNMFAEQRETGTND